MPRFFEPREIVGQAVAAALGAAIFAAASYLVNVISNGVVIHLLGGVTYAELNTKVASEVAAQSKPSSSPPGQLKWHAERGGVAPGTDTTYTASCQAGETIIGGYCEVEAGEGYLFNAGLMPNATYQCSWHKSKEGSFAAVITAACTGP